MKKKLRIEAFGDKVIFDAPLLDFPVDNSFVIEKSIEYFNDPEPCFIHRSAVVTRLVYELDDFITQNGGEIDINSVFLPDTLKRLLSVMEGAEKVIIY